MDVNDWEEAGLYDPDDPNASERLALLEYLTERGATLEQMVEAHEARSLPGVAGDLVTQGSDELLPLSEISARSGVSVPRVMRAMLAAGIPVTPESNVPSNLVTSMNAFEAGSHLMGVDAILAFARVLGASGHQHRRSGAKGEVERFARALGNRTGWHAHARFDHMAGVGMHPDSAQIVRSRGRYGDEAAMSVYRGHSVSLNATHQRGERPGETRSPLVGVHVVHDTQVGVSTIAVKRTERHSGHR